MSRELDQLLPTITFKQLPRQLRPTVSDFRWVMIWHAFLDQTSGNQWQVCTKFRAKTPFQATFNTELQWLTTQGDRLKLCVWKKIGPAFTVHSTDSASQLMESTVQLHGLLACVPRGWVLRPRALLNTEQRCVEGCWKLYETCCTQEIYKEGWSSPINSKFVFVSDKTNHRLTATSLQALSLPCLQIAQRKRHSSSPPWFNGWGEVSTLYRS